MRVMMIRHGKVNMPWKKKYNSKEYDQAWVEYDKYDILPISDRLDIYPNAKVLVSPYKRTHQTAEQFLGVHEYTVINDLLDEIPLRSFIETNRRFRKNLMNFLGRVEWYLPLKRQPERRRASRERAARMVDLLEKMGDGDYVLVMHGFYMRTLASMFRHRGYKVRHQPFFAVPNLYTSEACKISEAS